MASTGAWVVEELCAHLASGRSMITNMMYASMCGSRASEPSSRSRVNLHDTRTRGGDWREPARRSLWLVVKSCAWEQPARALVPLSGSCPHAWLSALHACYNAAARTDHERRSGADIRAAECGGWRVSKLFLLCSHARKCH